MRVTPKLVGAPSLHIDKVVRRIPALDLRQPSKRNPSDAQGVCDGGSRLHHDGRRSENPEAQPKRSDLFQILGAREEVKDCPQGMWDPQFPMERIGGHDAQFAERSLDTSDESAW